jgi:hypothetical protein
MSEGGAIERTAAPKVQPEMRSVSDIADLTGQQRLDPGHVEDIECSDVM